LLHRRLQDVDGGDSGSVNVKRQRVSDRSKSHFDKLVRLEHLIDDAHHCPHGRPTALVLSRNELDRQFGRLG
jgi:DNA mismatch repair ATPase MutL